MLTRSAALGLVEAHLDKLAPLPEGDSLVILEQQTIERPFGWVFFYGSRLFQQTGEFRFALAGNAPLIVNRDSGALVTTGTAYSVEHYIAEYEASLLTPSGE